MKYQNINEVLLDESIPRKIREEAVNKYAAIYDPNKVKNDFNDKHHTEAMNQVYEFLKSQQ